MNNGKRLLICFNSFFFVEKMITDEALSAEIEWDLLYNINNSLENNPKGDEFMNKLPERHEIDDKYKWRLEDIYETEEAFEKDFEKAGVLCGSIAGMQGRLGDEGALLKCLKSYEEASCLVENLFTYAKMRMDEDNSNSHYQVLFSRARELAVKAGAAASYMEPEILALPEETVDDSRLGKYRKFLDEILRKKKHTLSVKEEKLLAKSAEVASASGEIFSMFNNADIKFPEISDEKGEKTELTKGRYITFMESRDRDVRKAAYEAMYDTYGSYVNTLAASYAGEIKAARFFSEARGYSSSLEASLDEDNVDVQVYGNLVDTINDNLHLLHKYVKTRARVLGLDKIGMYDLYVPLVDTGDKKYEFEQGRNIVAEGLCTLGDEYVGILKKGFDSGWIDVYENKGKTSGAYSWGTYLSHPFVLLNYQGTLDNVFTLAHEMGHSLHTYYSTATQPYIYAGYKIFVAEVASTVNEILLLKYMINNTDDEKEKAYLANHFLETFRGTVFRQTMFAEFERDVHASFGGGRPLSADDLCDIYKKLNKNYYGEACDVDDRIKYEWSRIPHFYRSFYVYKYATGFSAAAAIVKMIETEGGQAVDRYIEFLKAGDSLYPLDALAKAGVDLSSPEPIEAGMQMFKEFLEEFASVV